MQRFWLENWRVEVDAGSITINGKEHQVRHKVMKVLVFLANNCERIVTRDELIAKIWNGNDAVGDKALTNAIWQLRSTIQSADEDPDLVIRTIPKTGYQLIKPVRLTDVSESETMSSRRRMLVVAVALVMLVVGTYLYSIGNGTDWNDLATTRLSDTEGTQTYLRVSPSGKYAAFLSEEPDGAELFITDLTNTDGRMTLKLTQYPGIEIRPAWSPDERYLAFVRLTEERQCQFIKLNIQSLQEEMLFPCQNPDASYVTFGENEHEMYTFDVLQDEQKGTFKRVNLKNNTTEELPIATSTRYLLEGELQSSPDGQWLALVKSGGVDSQDLYLYHIASQELKRLTFDNALIHGFSWSPDSDELVFSSDRDGQFRLWTISISDTVPKPLHIDGSYPGWAMDKNALLFEYHQTKVSLASVAVDQITPVVDVYNFAIPEINSKFQIGAESGNALISDKPEGESSYVFRISNLVNNSDNLIGLPEDYQDVAFAQFSPSENRIAFLARTPRDEYLQIYTYDLHNNSYEQISKASGDHFALQWAADGNALLAATAITGRWNVWHYDLTDHSYRQLTQSGGGLLREYQSDWIYSKADSSGLWLSSSNAQEQKLAETRHYDWGNWSILGDDLIFIKRTATHDVLVRKSLKDNREQTLQRFKSGTVVKNGIFSPDLTQRRVYFMVNEVVESDILIKRR